MRKNRYWGHDIAPIDCQYTIKCPHLRVNQFDSFVRDIQREGIYYTHETGGEGETRDTSKQKITMAFESKEDRDAHAVALEFNAGLSGYKIKSNVTPPKQDIKQFFTPKK